MVLLIAAFLVNSGIAQTTTINESFETWTAPDWNIYNLDAGGEWRSSSFFGPDRGFGGGNAAEHRISNDDCNNWLVSPQISVIEDTYELSFYEYSKDLQYYLFAGVYISVGSGDPADGDFVLLSESVQTEEVWEQQNIDLSAYQGDDIYIAFRYTGTWHHWRIDEVVVAPNTLIDGALTQVVNPTGIDPVSGIKDVIVTLKNFGSEVIDNADFEWSINGAQQATYQGSSLGLNPGSEMDITVGQYDFTAQGDYLISANLSLTADINPTNDTIESTYFVTVPKDGELTGVYPQGYMPNGGVKDVSITVLNDGNVTIDSLKVNWVANGIPQTEYQNNAISIAPGEEIELIIGQYDFLEGLNEISGNLFVSGDEDLSNNTNIAYVAVNILWESFEGNEFPPELWTAKDYPLKDYFFPEPHGDFYYYAQADDNYFGQISDTLFTPLLDIQAGDIINFWVKNSAFFTCDDKLIWKDGITGEIHEITDIVSELEDWDEVNIDISTAAGTNYIGFVNTYGSGYGASSIDLITSTASIHQFQNDLGIRKFEFEKIALIETPVDFNVTIRNYGINEVLGSSYSIKIINGDGEQLVEQSGVTLQSWDETTIQVNYTFVANEVQKVHAVIEYTEDQAVENNTSIEYGVYSVPADVEIIDVGSPDTENLNLPFDGGGDGFTLGTDDISQNLYYQEELPDAGYLYGITIYYHELFAVGQYLPLQVWIKETGLENLTAGWTSFDGTQMVFNDTIEIYPGHNSVYIPFEEPFLVTGTNNLVIQYHQYEPEWPYTAVRFYTTNVSEGPVRAIRLFNVYDLDIEDLPDYWGEHTDYVYTSFVYHPIVDLGVVSGIVYDESNNPIEGALIEVTGTSIEEYSNANGEYILPELPYASFELTASYFGYGDVVQDIDISEPNTTIDFNLELLPLVNLQGVVYGSNEPDVPLEGVTVTLEGYDNLSGNTNMNGLFFFENVFGDHEYVIKLQLYGYDDYIDTLTLENIDIDLGEIVLNQENISPYSVNATASLNMAVIEWFNPVTSKKEKLQNDSDVPSYSFTNEPYEEVWLGNLFENEEMVTITSVEIFWDVYENAHDYITVDILDEFGNVLVTSEPTITFNDSLMTIDVPNITVSGWFYAMVHWQDNEFSTDPLAIDYEEGTPNTAYIKYPGEAPVLLSDFLGSPEASWMLRANVLKEDNLDNEGGPVSYNIYRGLVEEMGDVNEWIAINDSPINELVYFDSDFSIIDFELYTYAVEAVYVEGISEKTFSNFVELITGIEEIQQYDVEVYPNPASSFVNLNGIMGARISIHNMIGAMVYSEDIQSETARVNVSDLPMGNYIIRITDPKSEKQLVKKFIIAR